MVIIRPVIFILLLLALSSMALTLKVGYYENPPMCYSSDGDVAGIFTDILKAVAEKENWNLEFVKVKFGKGLEMIRKGELDIFLDVAQTPERETWALFNSETVFYNWGDVYVSKDSRINSLEDLKGSKIAIAMGDVYAEEFKKMSTFFELSIRFFEIMGDYPDVLEAVLKGRAIGGVFSRIYGTLYAEPRGLKALGLMIMPVRLKYMFRKGVDRAVIETLDSYLRSWKTSADSPYHRIVSKYLGLLTRSPVKIWKVLTYLSLAAGSIVSTLMIFLFLLKRAVKIRTLELLREKERIHQMNEELEAVNQELRMTQEELENVVERLSRLIELISGLGREDVSEEEMLKELLTFALQNVPEADYGSVWIIKNGLWKLVAAIGHDETILKNLEIDARYLYPAKDVEVVDIIDYDLKNMPPNIMKAVRSATKPISKTMIAPLKVGDEYLGNFGLDIAEGKNEEFSENSIEFVRALVRLASAFIANKRISKLRGEFFRNMLTAMVRLIELRDPYTRGHSERVARLGSTLAEWVGLDRDGIRTVFWAGLVHDVGKVLIEDSILNKPGRFTPEEKEKMNMHPVYGADILERVKGMEKIAKIVRHHHERWDGSGYPDGLSGEDIPVGARILAVVDAFDAMMSDRPYRKSLGIETTLREIRKGLKSQFDPEIGAVFLKMIVESDVLYELYGVKIIAS